MKRKYTFLKLAAVANAVLLLVGYVSYSAGAFNWLAGANSSPDFHSTSPTKQPEADSNDSADPAAIRWKYDFSPASYPKPDTPTDSGTPDQSALISGSKSATIRLLPPSPKSGSQPPQATALNQSPLIGGSKSIVIQLTPPNPTAKKQKSGLAPR